MFLNIELNLKIVNSEAATIGVIKKLLLKSLQHPQENIYVGILGSFLSILRVFKNTYFEEHMRTAAFVHSLVLRTWKGIASDELDQC